MTKEALKIHIFYLLCPFRNDYYYVFCRCPTTSSCLIRSLSLASQMHRRCPKNGR